MRLFQAQNFYGDITSPPPPPHFSIDREATRVMPVYLNQYRDGRRLPTPEKVAVMELSNSFERRRLGKHQRILNDISERCRAQEITDLSNKLSAKKTIYTIDKPTKEMTFYSTTFMGSQPRKIPTEAAETGNSMSPTDDDASRPLFEKNYRQFPARRIMRQQTKFDFLRQKTSFPKLSQPTAQIVPKSSVSDSQAMNLRAGLAQRQQINGPIQLDHYTSPRPDLAPLVLPTLERYNTGIQSERLDRSEMCFSTSRVTLGHRTRTQLTIDTTRSGTIHLNQTVPPVGLTNYGHELSQLQLTSGHSPPPNSVHEVTADAS
ncbi:uncharacterized protein LOC123553173 [Mercenaria mercenaria]|uniref:uncharacterized protein LOC123553173 n=1 Tax=Mercenaria mercenaria TaxID=6596 RepID=UPI00234E494B|nr:uncharacterized protein LOC123553173 [Mercenaria mercenaria]